VVATFLLSGLLLVAAGQDFKISDNADYVLLDVSVRDRDGSFVTGLEKANFQVFEDGHPRPITYFSAMDSPVAIGLIVDNSGSMAAKRARVIAAGLAFAKQSNPQDEFFVVNFNDSIRRGLPPSIPFTDNLQLLRKALYYGEPQGKTALYDAVSYGLRHLERSREQRRTLIVVTDGRDNASQISFSALMKDLEASRATVYTVGLSDPDEERELNDRVLRKMAQVTGGEFFEPAAIGDVGEVFEKIAGDVRHRYSVEYAPDEIHDHNPVRRVKVVVRVESRKLQARTRTSYSVARASE
jgi:Ca-activated chloride channel family protein